MTTRAPTQDSVLAALEVLARAREYLRDSDVQDPARSATYAFVALARMVLADVPEPPQKNLEAST